MNNAASRQIDESILKEIESLAEEALVGLEVFDSVDLEVTELDLARMAEAFQFSA
jgi:hypothetical protein